MKTLKEYILDLQKLVEENPEAANFTVIFSKDSEGNGYDFVYYEPTIGYYNEDDLDGFISEDKYHEYDGLYTENSNVVCIN